MRIARPSLLIFLFAGLALPASGSAAVTIGQAPPATGMPNPCNPDTGQVQGTAPAGISYVVPAGGGVITQWRHQAGTTGGTLALQTLSRQSNTEFTPLFESAAETPAASALNTFETRISVAGGEYIGLRILSGTPECRYFTGGADETLLEKTAPAPVVGSGPTMFGNGLAGRRLNLAAVIEPDADGDGFGDETQDGCITNAQRQDDCVKPAVRIDRAPKKKSRKPKAIFAFSSNEAGASFECSLDDKRFKACASPLRLRKPPLGKHRFEVRAIDANENVSQPASYTWRVKKKKRR